jgi:hypothetical protein
MSCEIDKRVKIYTGENKTLSFRLLSDVKNGTPFDLTAATEIQVSIPKSDGTAIVKKLSLSEVTMVNALDGKFSTALLPVDTAALEVGAVIAVEIKITIATVVTIVQISEALNVISSLFP